MTEQQLQEIEARAKSATPGSVVMICGELTDDDTILLEFAYEHNVCGYLDLMRSKEFHQAAYSDIPMLVAEVRKLQEENSKLKQGSCL